MFKATNVKVHVGFGYYLASITYKYNSTGKSYLRYDFTSPTSMIELIDYSEGTRSKVCSSCETGFYPYTVPLLYKQPSDIPTGEVEGECKEYTPIASSSVNSLWYKENGDLCKVALADGRTLDFNGATIDAAYKDETVFNLEGRECPGPVCKRIMDIVFVIDSSGSVDKDNWETIKDFLKAVVGSFEIGPDATMVGIVSYGKSAVKVLDLTADPNTVNNAINTASYCGGTTCTGCGIIMGLDILNSTTDTRDKLDPEKIMMVLTDGENNEIDNQYFCRKYEPVCTKRSTKCVNFTCDGTMKKKSTSICTKYEDDKSACLKYKCASCKKTGSCVRYKDKCEKYSVTECQNYSTTFCEGNPSSYCCSYNRLSGTVRNKEQCGKCECTEYKSEKYKCEKYKCDASDCDECRRYSSNCLIYKKKCTEYMEMEYCDGKEICQEYECVAGTIKCAEKDLGANSYLSGAVSKVRTQWALYPKSTRIPVIFAIGVKGANMYELKGIGSTINGKQFVYKVNEFTDLFSIINELVDETCTKQTTSLEGCSADCHGFCGCNKQCYCPTCEEPSGQCYAFSCRNDNTTSTGCVPTHMKCERMDMCHNVVPDNATDGCCRQDPINCVKSDDKCVEYGCNPHTGCTAKTRECVPESPCFNLTGCDNRTGCQFISACPYLGPCNISTCTVIDEATKEFSCSYADKCKSDDPCMIPVCDVETGECSKVPMVCTPSNPCNYARCYDGRCIEDVNITHMIECALEANTSCEEGYCDEETGECKIRKVEGIDNCLACIYNDSLDCSELDTGCKTFKCAPLEPNDPDSTLTTCTISVDKCPESEDPCINRYCDINGECKEEPVVCGPADDLCHEKRCIPDPDDPKKSKCDTISFFKEPDNNCFMSVCTEDGNETRVNRCPQKHCFNLTGCVLDVNGEAICNYKPVVCPSTACAEGVCNPDTNQCELLDNSSNCNLGDACTMYTCRSTTGCHAEPITCDDNDPCTIDSCVPLNASDSLPYSSSDIGDGYVCLRQPVCFSDKFCERVSCNSQGNCTWVQYDCEDRNANSTLDSCLTYKCDEASRSCKPTLLPTALLDVCGGCIKIYSDNSTVDVNALKNRCIAGMKMPEFTAVIGAAAVAGIVIAAIIVAAAIGISSAIGTKELIKRAKKNADVATNSNPLYEDNTNEFNNPTFTGETGDD